MANVKTSNPISIDTASGSTLTGLFYVQCIQWIDDAADIADDDDLSFSLNGVTVAQKVQLTANAVGNTVVYQAGPFASPIAVKDFVVNTIDHGVVLVWIV